MEVGAIKLAFSKVLDEINAKLSEVQQIDEVKTYLTNQEHELRLLERRLQTEQQELAEQKKKLDEESAYNTSYIAVLKEKEYELMKAKDALGNVKEEEQLLKVKNDAVEQEKKILERKKKEVAEFEKDLIGRSALLDQEKIFDVNRKLLLDAREAKIKKRETQLRITSQMIES